MSPKPIRQLCNKVVKIVVNDDLGGMQIKRIKCMLTHEDIHHRQRHYGMTTWGDTKEHPLHKATLEWME